MNNIIAEKLKIQLTTALPFIDRAAGLVRSFYKSEGNPDNSKNYTKRYPVACKESEACSPSDIMDMIPNAKYNCMIYFEDEGVTYEGQGTNGIQNFISRLTLVCWFNTSKFQATTCTITDEMAIAMITNIRKDLYADGIIHTIKHQIKGAAQKSASTFQRYTYSEFKLSYLNPPYDYFTIPIETTFSLTKNCQVMPALKTDLTCL